MRVAKWGGSLAVRLPKALVEELGLKAGDELALVEASKERLIVEKDARRRRAIERMGARASTASHSMLRSGLRASSGGAR